MKSPQHLPPTATEQAIETIARIDENWLTVVLGLNHKFDAMIALLSDRERRGSKTDRLNVSELEIARLRRDLAAVLVSLETYKRETGELVKHYAPLSARFWNWLVGFLRGNE